MLLPYTDTESRITNACNEQGADKQGNTSVTGENEVDANTGPDDDSSNAKTTVSLTRNDQDDKKTDETEETQTKSGTSGLTTTTMKNDSHENNVSGQSSAENQTIIQQDKPQKTIIYQKSSKGNKLQPVKQSGISMTLNHK